jgi:apolipoprotein N-acyltransferase
LAKPARWRPGWGAAALAAVSGLLLTAAFPPMNLWPLALVGLLPLIYLARRFPPRRALVAGLIWGMALFSGLMYWLFVVFSVYGGLSWPLSVATLAVFAFYLGGYAAIWACLLSWWGPKPWALLIAGPLIWVGLEWLRSQIFTGIIWLPYSMGLTGSLPLIQSLEFWSTTGLSLILVLVNCLLAVAVLPGMRRGGFGRGQAAAILALIVILAGGWLWGSHRLEQVTAAQKAAPQLTVSVVQGNIPLNQLWNRRLRPLVLQRLMDLTDKAAAQVPQRPWLVVWPESAAPFYFLRNAKTSQPVLDYAKQKDIHLLLGALGVVEKGERLQVSNRIWMLDPDGTPNGYYDKVRLVPFGEYVPWQPLLFFVRAVAQIGDDFAVGEIGKTLSMGGVGLGPVICYESIFPELARQQRLRGARLLINPTNDAWFGRTTAPYQHMAHLAFRAVENRMASARSANTGVSGFILPTGEQFQTTGLFVPAVETAQLPLMNESTFFSRHGETVGPVALAAALIMYLATWWRRRKNKENKDV